MCVCTLCRVCAVIVSVEMTVAALTRKAVLHISTFLADYGFIPLIRPTFVFHTFSGFQFAGDGV